MCALPLSRRLPRVNERSETDDGRRGKKFGAILKFVFSVECRASSDTEICEMNSAGRPSVRPLPSFSANFVRHPKFSSPPSDRGSWVM